MFHVEQRYLRIFMPIITQEFMVNAGDEHLTFQFFKQPAQSPAVLLVKFRGQVVYQINTLASTDLA